MQNKKETRREFLRKTAMAGMAPMLFPYLPLIPADSKSNGKIKTEPLVILFQGDSITDGNRGRNNDPNHIMGHGYAFSIASRAGALFPEKDLLFFNRGISGNTVQDVKARWQKDVLELKPGVLSMLVGVNDTEHALQQKDAAATTKYEADYRLLLHQTKNALPECMLVLCEPFIAPVGRVKDNWNAWQSEIEKKQQVVQRLAKEYGAVLVPLQKVFDDAARRAPAGYWIWDGIHPTVAGHELITQAWLQQVGKQLRFFKKLL